jgi:Tol biopolymer transport system component
VAFGSYAERGTEVFVINSDGSGLTHLTSNYAYDGDPSISGNGTRIAFTCNVGTGIDEIYLLSMAQEYTVV